MVFVAEAESEPEVEDKSGNSNHPRDSGCFESSENLEGGREAEEGNKEGPLEEQEKEAQEEEENQLDAVQQLLEELTLDEGS